MLIPAIILLLPGSSYELVDCVSGFVGRMQASIGTEWLNINDTSMCSASYCIKVIVHSALDDDNTFQQGISSRCAYTGGDRQVCARSRGGCENINFYDGMRGNFSFCCCQSSYCNSVSHSDLSEIYSQNMRITSTTIQRQGNFSSNWQSISLILIFTITIFMFNNDNNYELA